MPTLRADLHVHSLPFAVVNGDLSFLKSRDCYSPPADVYRVARPRGMDLVAITDHDTSMGASSSSTARGVRRLPDGRGSIVPVPDTDLTSISASTA